MRSSLKLAAAGVGNNISALCQGVKYYATNRDYVGIKNVQICNIYPSNVEFVNAFDIDHRKVGKPLREAIFAGENNYPDLHQDISDMDVVVESGIEEHTADDDKTLDNIVQSLVKSKADVLLYSLPTGLQWAATAYAKAAYRAGVAFVNCTPEIVARSEEMMRLFEEKNIPLLGDDLASHIGSSVIHKELLALLVERGITLENSYQVNMGGNSDFQNLSKHGSSKRQSKLNCLAQKNIDISKVEVIPSAGFLAQLEDHKVAYMNIEGRGWAGTPILIDLKLKVQDSSNAAGVIIDLIRIAAAAKYKNIFGFVPAAAPLLKSPPGGHGQYSPQVITKSLEEL